MVEEIWKDIPNYEGYYQVSNYGRVRSLNKVVKCNRGTRLRKIKILRSSITNRGYLSVGLCKENRQKKLLVHRLVAEAFIPNPHNLPIVNHKDENQLNNCTENLEWCTQKYNVNYGTAIQRMSEKLLNNPKTSKTVLQFDLKGNFIREWISASECGRNGFTREGVCYCCNGIRKTHRGYKWRYKEEG